MKYVKKPVVIEAIQLTKELALDCWRNNKLVFEKFHLSGSYHLDRNEVYSAYIVIETPEGNMTANLDDWIIKGVKGEYYPCKPDIFEMTYEVAPEETKNHPLGREGKEEGMK